MTDLTYAELFAGAGGLSMGLEMAGWQAVAHAEIDKHARAVLRKHWPDCRLDGDVSALNGADYRGVTLLSGGSPCQDLSIAGKRKGLGGERSGLFHQQVRIWRESGAPYILWENVLGALSSNKGADFGVVLSTIVGAAVPVPADGWRGAGVASGPAGVAAWRVLDAQYFGVPQRRRRVFVLGVADGSVDPAEVLSLGESLSGHPAAGREAGEGAAADTRASTAMAFNWQSGGDCRLGESDKLVSAIQVSQTPAVLRSAIPLDVRNATRTTDVSEHNRQGLGVGEDGDPSPTLTGLFTPAVLTYDTRGNGDGRVVNTMAGDHQNRVTDYTAIVDNNRGNEQVIGVDKQSGHPFEDVAPTMKTDQAHQMGPVVLRNPDVLAFDAFNQQETGSLSKTLGVGSDYSHVPIAMTLRNREGKPGGGKGPLLSAERSLTLGTANDQVVFTKSQVVHPTLMTDHFGKHAGCNQHVAELAQIMPAIGIPRRLTPVECERLMGWPDGRTAYGVDEQGREYALADTARYKLCGNGCAAPVVAWIGFRLRGAIDNAATGNTL